MSHSSYKTILCCGFCNLMCVLSYTRAYYNLQKSYVNLGFANRLSTRFNYIFISCESIKKKEENDRYPSSILAMQVVFFFKWACSLNFINTGYKVMTNAIFLWTRSLYKILYFAVNILKKTEILVKFSFSYEVMVKCFLQKNTTPSWS